MTEKRPHAAGAGPPSAGDGDSADGASTDAPTAAYSAAASGKISDQIGPYRVLREIGVGGMGVVYEAEQYEPVPRRVALKLIKLGMDSTEMLARFDSERQALAIMDHPNIARVFDAGMTEEGRPYIVMEFIRGVNISKYCDRERLSTRARLELFRPVCDAVQHAHQKGILHRDIKPSNVLITLIDDRPMAKIIDFGVAKATSAPLSPYRTQLGQPIGTLQYMSPEQAGLIEVDIDTRSDVYSLGALLYELLVGAPPLQRGGKASELEELRRTIRDEEPERPSTKLSTSTSEVAEKAAARRHTDPKMLVKSLKGDLDWITMKALEKERGRRYSSAAELAADITRHLENQPILASPPSRVYRMRKFVRRHRVGVAAAAVVLLALLVAVASTSVALVRITKAERHATEEARTAERVSQFLAGLFENAAPHRSRGRVVTAREMLDMGAERVGGELQEEPKVQTQLYLTLGNVYHGLGSYEEAEKFLLRSLDMGETLADFPSTSRAAILEDLAWLRRSQGRTKEGLARAEEALSLLEKEVPEDSPDLAPAHLMVGILLRDSEQYDRARQHLQRALGIAERDVGGDQTLVARIVYHEGWLLNLMAQYEAARQNYERALAIFERTEDPPGTFTAWCLNDLAIVVDQLGDSERARELHLRALAVYERIMGPDHPDLSASLNNLGSLHWYRGEYEESRRYYERALEIRRKALRPDHPDIAGSIYNLGLVSLALGELSEAEGLFLQAQAIWETNPGPDSLAVSSALHDRGVVLGRMGKLDAAEALIDRALTIRERKLGTESREFAESASALARIVRRKGEHQRAEALFGRALAICEKVLGPEHALTASVRKEHSELLLELGDDDRAAEIRAGASVRDQR